MFRILFRTILIIFILIVFTISLAVWKGGEPFRWMGGKIEIAGKTIERFGDRIDGMKKGSEKIIELKETFDSIQGNEQKQSEDKDGAINKD